MARSNFYYHRKKSKSEDKYQVIKELIKSIYHKHKGSYGYRRITDERNNKGMVINDKTVLRLMKLLGLKSLIRVKKYKSYKGEQGKIAPNLLKRNFKAEAPNQKWATDITEFNISGKKLYFRSTYVDGIFLFNSLRLKLNFFICFLFRNQQQTEPIQYQLKGVSINRKLQKVVQS